LPESAVIVKNDSMKFVYNIVLSLTILCISFGCKKDYGDANKSIIGKWELRQVSGGMIAGATKYPPGNGSVLVFDGNNYEIHANGNITRTGQYNIVKVNDATVENNVCLVLPKGQFTTRIIYDNDTSSVKKFFQVKGNQLTFYSGCYAYDAGTNQIYEKVSN
jgi:hypothetical protein